METSQLQALLEQINEDLLSNGSCVLPDRFDSFEKYQKKALKLKEHLVLEVEERGQVDNVLNFFLQSSSDFSNDKFLDDDQFYKPMNVSSTNSTVNSQVEALNSKIEKQHEDFESENLQASEDLEPEDNFSE